MLKPFTACPQFARIYNALFTEWCRRAPYGVTSNEKGKAHMVYYWNERTLIKGMMIRNKVDIF